MSGPRVLIVENDKAIAELMANALSEVDAETRVVLSAEEALHDAPEFGPDVVVCDYLLPGMNGVEFLDALRAMRIGCPVMNPALSPHK